MLVRYLMAQHVGGACVAPFLFLQGVRAHFSERSYAKATVLQLWTFEMWPKKELSLVELGGLMPLCLIQSCAALNACHWLQHHIALEWSNLWRVCFFLKVWKWLQKIQNSHAWNAYVDGFLRKNKSPLKTLPDIAIGTFGLFKNSICTHLTRHQ